MWIRHLLKKLPMKEFPNKLRAKPRTRWQPPRFVFGIPVDSAEQLFKLAKDNGFPGIDPKLDNPNPKDVNSLDLKKTLRKLDKKLRKDLGIRSSYDEKYAHPPAELSQLIQDYLAHGNMGPMVIVLSGFLKRRILFDFDYEMTGFGLKSYIIAERNEILVGIVGWFMMEKMAGR
ncbi:hypothetical protein BDQ17DRAFT_1330126 [Cyathus striatus]|nr:hypothetical protein BDQ17DRAFT_1330126 [Cyathus striatus]